MTGRWVRRFATALAISTLSGCATLAPIQPKPPYPPEAYNYWTSHREAEPCGMVPSPALNAAMQRFYPPEAQDRGIQGWVVLDLAVGEDGRLVTAEPVYSAPAGVFEDAAQRVFRSQTYPNGPRECVVAIAFVLE